jgi:hypothetical protein
MLWVDFMYIALFVVRKSDLKFSFYSLLFINRPRRYKDTTHKGGGGFLCLFIADGISQYQYLQPKHMQETS